MNATNRERVKRLLDEAARLPVSARAAFVERESADDPGVLAEVRELLGTLDDPLFLNAPTLPGLATAAGATSTVTAVSPIENAGARIGRYKLLQQIGEGGFGTVFMAEQAEPVTRRVALKIIKAGMDTRQVIARFEAERQALALMDHPNIARVLDAGATDSGRPYFVMELVRGEPVTQYCDRETFSVEQRLALFRDICLAVQHAHQKGIIHRDLKPRNVLVTVADGQPVPKVIDFGIAKATGQQLTDRTLYTELHQLIGTPEYMSPEQAEPASADIDTRSDVYSLGVLLYELLTGTTPFDARSLMESGLPSLVRTIREVDPPRPSLRLATLATPGSSASLAGGNPADAEDASSVIEIARRRRAEPRQLSRRLRGDLDWIVMKCLEKDRRRRYETVSALAEDIQNYLRHQPVSAIPPSTGYKLRKFVQRNRGQVIAGGVILGTLLAGLVGTSTALVWALMEQRRANEAVLTARQSAQETRQVAAFQSKMLSEIDPAEVGARLARDLRARFDAALAREDRPDAEQETRRAGFTTELNSINTTDAAAQLIDETILRPARAAIEREFSRQPAVDAALRHTLAGLYAALGRNDDALPLLEQALATRRRVLGDEHADTIESLASLGHLQRERGDARAGELLCREALEKSGRVLGLEHTTTLSVMNELANALEDQDQFDAAEPYRRQSLETRRRMLGPDHPDTIDSISAMGIRLRSLGRYSEAEPYFTEALETRRRTLGAANTSTIASLNNLGALLQAEGKLADAERCYREGLEACQRARGDAHPLTITLISNLGMVLLHERRIEQAEQFLRDAMEKQVRVQGKDHPDALLAKNNLGELLFTQGKLQEAESALRDVVAAGRRVLGQDHSTTTLALNNLGRTLQVQGQNEEAERCFRDAVEGARRMLGAAHPNTTTFVHCLGSLLLAQRRFDEAEPFVRQAFDQYRTAQGETSINALVAACNLGNLLRATGRFAAAEEILAPAAAAAEKALPRQHSIHGAFIRGMVKLYDAWDKAEAGGDHVEKLADWSNRLESWAATTRPSN
ncbi:MAG: serine/threonine-protein kinase [Phycisphaerae bacterium]